MNVEIAENDDGSFAVYLRRRKRDFLEIGNFSTGIEGICSEQSCRADKPQVIFYAKFTGVGQAVEPAEFVSGEPDGISNQSERQQDNGTDKDII